MNNNVFTEKHADIFINELMKIFEEKFQVNIDYTIKNKERSEKNKTKIN